MQPNFQKWARGEYGAYSGRYRVKTYRNSNKTVKMSLHPQPHCATATGFHDNMSIVPERYDHEVFKKMSFENSNSKFVTATGAA